MNDFYPPRSSEPEVREHEIRILGTGAADPTLELGHGVAVTHTGTGAYKITWDRDPGTFLRWFPGLGAATPADLAGYTVVRDTYDAATRSLAFVVYDETFAPADLAATQYLDLGVRFKATYV